MGTLIRSSRSVLVVDDDADVRAVHCHVLEQLGLGVIEAANGQEALAVLASRREVDILLILLDLRMPVMNGWEFLELLRKHVPVSRIPVVVLSAHAHANANANERKAPKHPSVVAWLQAPYPIAQLRELVSSLAPS